MEAVTVLNAYTEYQSMSQSLSRQFGPKGASLDHSARGYEDYVQDLRLRAGKIADRFQRSFGFCGDAERRYTYRGLFHQVCNWRRADSRRQQRVQQLELAVHTHVPVDYEMETAFEARQTLHGLLSAFTPEDRQVLLRVAQAGGSVRAAWEESTDGPFRTFARKVSRLRSQAKAFKKD